MTYEGMVAFAEAWIDNWNRRDVDAVLGDFAADAQFVSPLAVEYSGTPLLAGHQAIGDYWRTARSRFKPLEFAFDHALWDEHRQELLVVYETNINDERQRAAVSMRFGTDGKVTRAEAFYGAAI